MAIRFRVAGFPVHLTPFFPLVAVMSGAADWRSPGRLAVWFCVVSLSVLLHELGHAVELRRLGQRASISLHALGGMTTSEGGRALTFWEDLGTHAAGPVVSFLLGGVMVALKHLTPLGRAEGLALFTLDTALWVNLGWGLLNLLPLVPLDGSELAALVLHTRGASRFEWLLPAFSLVAGLCGLGLAVTWKLIWLGVFSGALALVNVGQLAQEWLRHHYTRQLRATTKGLHLSVKGEAAPSVERFLANLRKTPPPASPAAPQSPFPSRPPPTESKPEPDDDFPEPPRDPRFVGELLLSNGLPELAISPLRAAFEATPSAPTGHALVTALLETRRYGDISRLLSQPGQAQLTEETLLLIISRAEAAAQPALAARAHELRQGRTRSEPLGARGPHDSKKRG
jgi:hypothetical protein